MKSGEVKLFVGILVAAVALAAVAIYPAIVAARNTPQAVTKIRDPIKAKVTRADLFPDGAWHKGDPKAPYLVVEFADYQCPLCATAVEEVKNVLAKHKDKVCYVFHGIQIQGNHTAALIMAQAAEAAGQQGNFWEMHEALFKNQNLFRGLPDPDAVDQVIKIAKSLGLDMMKFSADLRNEKVLQGQARSGKIAIEAEVQATPTFFVVTPKGETLKLASLKEFVVWMTKEGNIQ
ncbi:MAG: thioredoxin domain-containing protein [Chthonomonadales bacterium]|nr:thioredoxin domain-containing protein [Chthonomonadales bacterium]